MFVPLLIFLWHHLTNTSLSSTKNLPKNLPKKLPKKSHESQSNGSAHIYTEQTEEYIKKKNISLSLTKKTHLHFIECSAPVVLDRWSFWVALGCTGDLDCLDVCIGLGEEWLTLEDRPLVKAVWGTGVLTWLWTLWIEGTLCGIKRSIWERLYKTLLSVMAVLNILKFWNLDIQIIINIPVLCSFCFSILQIYSFCLDLIFQHSCSND